MKNTKDKIEKLDLKIQKYEYKLNHYCIKRRKFFEKIKENTCGKCLGLGYITVPGGHDISCECSR